jgi:hypothetical protein
VSNRYPGDLQRALTALGVRCSVEAYDALAIAVPEPGERCLEIDEVRRKAIELARSHGFSHLAVELRKPERDAADRATLSGD